MSSALLTRDALDRSPELSPQVFQKIRKLVYDTAGIDLRDGKETLVAARLSKALRRLGHRSYEQYLDQISADRSGDSLIALIDVLTTNYTSFLREPAHFEFLKTHILPALAKRTRIQIWCAAAATGEEPYSFAFTLFEELGPSAADRCRILATDISTRALAQARAAIYPAQRFEGLPSVWLPKYLLRGEGKSHGLYKVKPEIARIVEFRRLNLVEAFDAGAVFPLIVCRNVMIYFDKPVQQKVVNRLTMFLEPGAHLFVGHSESLNGIKHSLQFVRPAIYGKP